MVLELIYREMYFLTRKIIFAHEIMTFSVYRKFDGHVLSRQPVLLFNVKLQIKENMLFPFTFRIVLS